MAFENAILTTVGEVLGQYRFLIPEYQRGYAWTHDQWLDLWEDVRSADLRTHTDHFAGSLMIRPRGGDARIEVVDGQQRLTSISLLLHALGHQGFDLEYENNEALQTYFDFYARGVVSVEPRLGQYRSFYARNLAQAAEFFRARTSDLLKEDQVRLTTVLLDRFRIFVLLLAPTFDVHVAFETINNRGKPLSVLEKLKNRLIYLCSVSADQVVGRAAAVDVHKSWKGIYHWLGRGQKLLDDDEFLRAHALGWFRKENRAEWLTSMLFDEEFSASSGKVKPHDVTAYAGSLEQLARWWFYLNHPDELPAEVCRNLRSLERTDSTVAKPLLLWALYRTARGHKALQADPMSPHDWSGFIGLVEQVERFAVLVLYGNNRSVNVGQSDFNRSAFLLAHASEQLNSGGSERLSGDKEAVEYARDHMKALVDNWSLEDFDNDEAELLDARFDFAGNFSPELMKTVIADRLRSKQGFYNWQFGKLLIYEWENHLRGTLGLPEKKAWEKFSWDESVEHIYPQTPVSEWSNSISLDRRSAEAMRNSVTNSIGNLLLLSRSRNASFSNNVYTGSSIPENGKRSHYSSGSWSEWQVAECASQWTIVAIAARGIAMMRFAQQRWKFRLLRDDAPLTDWLPFLFGDSAERIRDGLGSHGKTIDGRSLHSLVKKFETTRPG